MAGILAVQQQPVRQYLAAHPLAGIMDMRDARLSKNIHNVAVDYFKSKDFPKTISYTIEWISRFMPISSNVDNFGKFAKNVKNAMATANIYSSFIASMAALQVVWLTIWDPHAVPGSLRTAVFDWMRQTSDLSCNVCDALKLGNNWFTIPYMGYFDAFSSGSTFVGSVSNFADDTIKCMAEPGLMPALGLVMDMSYMMVGALGLYAWWMAAPVSVILVPLTIATMTSVFKTVVGGLMNPGGRYPEPNKVQRVMREKIGLEGVMAVELNRARPALPGRQPPPRPGQQGPGRPAPIQIPVGGLDRDQGARIARRQQNGYFTP